METQEYIGKLAELLLNKNVDIKSIFFYIQYGNNEKEIIEKINSLFTNYILSISTNSTPKYLNLEILDQKVEDKIVDFISTNDFEFDVRIVFRINVANKWWEVYTQFVFINGYFIPIRIDDESYSVYKRPSEVKSFLKLIIEKVNTHNKQKTNGDADLKGIKECLENTLKIADYGLFISNKNNRIYIAIVEIPNLVNSKICITFKKTSIIHIKIEAANSPKIEEFIKHILGF